MPCLPFETAAMGCTGGRIVVRAPGHGSLLPDQRRPLLGVGERRMALRHGRQRRRRVPRAAHDGLPRLRSRWRQPGRRRRLGDRPRHARPHRGARLRRRGGSALTADGLPARPRRRCSRLRRPAHGFAATLPAAAGVHNVCAYAINVGAGGSTTCLGCRTVTRPRRLAVRLLDVATGVPGGVTVGGWAIDPDTVGPIRGARLRRRRRRGAHRRRAPGPTSARPSPATAPATASAP